MTDETDETRETDIREAETKDVEPEAPAAEQAEDHDESDGDDESDESDDDDDDDDDEKKDKPKKVKIAFEATMPRGEAVSYFEAIVGGLRSGRLEFRQEGDTLILNPPDHVELEVKAQQKGNKGKIVFEIEWSDEHRPLEILN